MAALMGIFVLFGAVVLLGGAIAGLVWYVRHGLKSQEAATKLAALVGFQNLTPGLPPNHCWYGGVAQGRRVAIAMAAMKDGITAGERHYRPFLRVVMEVVVRHPLGVVAYRSYRDTSSLHRFEEAFSTKNCEELGGGARNAMMAFVAKGYATGLEGVHYRSSPGTRNLRLRDRAESPEGLMPPTVMADARVILVHDHPNPQISPDGFGQLLYELATVAYSVEQGK